MPKLSRILVVSALFLFAVIARPQGTVVNVVQTGNGAVAGSGAGQGSDGVRSSIGSVGGVIGGFSSSGMGGVKGVPFSADVIEETDHYLADGNHIHRESHGKTFRDSEGRTRTESEIGSGMVGSKPFVHIQIMDPVENAFILLNPQDKSATVHHFRERTAPTTFTPPPRINKPAQGAQAASGAVTPEALLQELRNKQESGAKREHSREDLGTMEMEGFTVKGVRMTTTTAAGVMGNDKPMTSTSERWFSDELKIDLVIKSSAPESGQHVRRLVNIRSGDPDPLLFQVPPDYTVKEQQQ
jgi:hypothetical protein